MDEISYTEDVLTIGGDEVQVAYDIKDVIIIDDVIVVLQEPPTDVDEEQNIVAFDQRGNKLWTVQRATSGYRTPRIFTYIRDTEGKLIADNWNGYKYTVDIEGGSVTKYKKYMK